MRSSRHLGRNLPTLLMMLSPLALGACESAAPAALPSPLSSPLPSAAGSKLLARVSTSGGTTAEFWQVDFGRYLFTESGGAGTQPTVASPDKQRLAALWAAVAPGRAMPKELAEADLDVRRATVGVTPVAAPVALAGDPAHAPEAPAARGVVHPLGGASPPPGDPNDFCNARWFYDHLATFYCNGGDSTLPYTWCFYDRWSPSASSGNVVSDQGAICNHASSNDVIFATNRDGGPSGSWSLPSQSWRTWSYTTGESCGLFSCSFNVYNASIYMSGSWGDMQFAGGFCQDHTSCTSD
jgi:hypothetical protein